MSIAVIRFPGTNNENDVLKALNQIPGANPYLVPSRKGLAGLKNAYAVVIPGGFSYGDYLRAGAVASVEVIVEGIRDLAEDGKILLPNEREQEAIRLVLSMHADGHSLRAIARELDQKGIASKKGGRWSHKQIQSILRQSA